MHEYSLVSSLLARVEAVAVDHPTATVARLRVRIGASAGVEPTLFQTAWDLIRTGTRCAAAELEIVPVPLAWACPRCDAPIAPGDILSCPDCSVPARLIAGDEIVLDRVELEVPDV